MSMIILEVNEVQRTLKASGAGAFVAHDKEVDIVRFAINSGFADIVLDGQVALRVMYQRPGESQVRAQTLTYHDTDGLHNYYDWQLSQSDLAKNGSLMVALCILRTDGDVEEWHTTPCQVRVLDTIHTDDSDEGDESIAPTVAQRVAVLETMIQRVASGAPIVVSSTSAMTDTDQIYVLSTDGNWYYHNGSAWTAGGEYGAVSTDTTLTQPGVPADAEAVGDRLTNLDNRFLGINAGASANYSTDGFYAFGGLEFARIAYPNNDIGEQMGAPTASTNRIATPKSIYVYHDIFVDIDSSGGTSKYQMYFFGVDAENAILSKYSYGATKLYLNAGIYYIMVRNSDNSDISAEDFDAIETLVKGYSFIDTSLLTEIDLDKTLVRCVYTVKDGAIVGAKANTTHLSLPPFKTAHTVKAVRTNTDYVLTDTITDKNGTITGTYSTADGDALFPKGVHHLTFALVDGALEPLSFSAMKTSHVLYATVSERLGALENDVADIAAGMSVLESQKIVARNYQNEIYYQAFSRTNNSEKGTNLIRLAHITDTHSDAEAWNRFLIFNNYINPHVTAIMHTGDIVKTTALDDYTYITGNLPGMRTILTVGNHDVGNEQGIGSGGLTNANCKQIFVSPLATKYGATNVIVPNDSNACYYYTDVKSDNSNRTLRIIVLNSYDYDANASGVFADRTHIHYSQNQIDWLIGVLQNANANSIPVCICAHECDAFLEASDGLNDPFNMSYDTPSSAGDHLYAKDWIGSPICDLVEAFISGGSISQTYDQGDFTVSVSASFSNTGHFVCWFTGHRHSDHIGFLPGYHQLNIAPANGGMTVTAKYSDLPRWDGTKSEDCFNMYSINLATKTIGIVRIGSDAIYSGADRKKTIVSYVKGD